MKKWVWTNHDNFRTKVNLDKIDNIVIGPDNDEHWILVKAWSGEGSFVLEKFPILKHDEKGIATAMKVATRYVDEITGE